MRPVQPCAGIVVVRNPRAGSAHDTAALQQALDDAGIAADIVDIPNGTLNHFARDAGIPTELEAPLRFASRRGALQVLLPRP